MRGVLVGWVLKASLFSSWIVGTLSHSRLNSSITFAHVLPTRRKPKVYLGCSARSWWHWKQSTGCWFFSQSRFSLLFHWANQLEDLLNKRYFSQVYSASWGQSSFSCWNKRRRNCKLIGLDTCQSLSQSWQKLSKIWGLSCFYGKLVARRCFRLQRKRDSFLRPSLARSA